jgi:hypothetical protein
MKTTRESVSAPATQPPNSGTVKASRAMSEGQRASDLCRREERARPPRCFSAADSGSSWLNGFEDCGVLLAAVVLRSGAGCNDGTGDDHADGAEHGALPVDRVRRRQFRRSLRVSRAESCEEDDRSVQRPLVVSVRISPACTIGSEPHPKRSGLVQARRIGWRLGVRGACLRLCAGALERAKNCGGSFHDITARGYSRGRYSTLAFTCAERSALSGATPG